MNITDLIEDLELDAMASQDAGRDGTLSMRAAGVLRKLHAVLTPFAEAAEKADKMSADQERLLGSKLTPDASPGCGIKRRHLDAAREILWENASVVAPGSAVPTPCSGCAELRNEIGRRVASGREWGAHIEAKGQTAEANVYYWMAAGLAELLEWIDGPARQHSEITDPNAKGDAPGATEPK